MRKKIVNAIYAIWNYSPIKLNIHLFVPFQNEFVIWKCTQFHEKDAKMLCIMRSQCLIDNVCFLLALHDYYTFMNNKTM